MWRHVYDIDMDIVKYKEHKRVKRKSELRSAPVAAQSVGHSAQGRACGCAAWRGPWPVPCARRGPEPVGSPQAHRASGVTVSFSCHVSDGAHGSRSRVRHGHNAVRGPD